MISSKNFVINDGENAGVYCSYCGEQLSSVKDEETGGFHYQCACADAKAEIILLTQQEELSAKIERFYAQREKQTKRIQLLAHRANIELQLEELRVALAELEEENEPEITPEHSENIESGEDSLKMKGPKLPDFKH